MIKILEKTEILHTPKGVAIGGAYPIYFTTYPS